MTRSGRKGIESGVGIDMLEITRTPVCIYKEIDARGFLRVGLEPGWLIYLIGVP